MATAAAPRARWRTERIFFTGIALAMLVATFIGFAPTYYLAPWLPLPRWVRWSISTESRSASGSCCFSPRPA